MKIIIRIIGTLLAIVKLSTASDLISEDPYLTSNIVGEVRNISISKLLDFKKIIDLKLANADEFEKARFYYIIAYEINNRLQELDKKFNTNEKEYHKTISNYEDELDLTPYQYTDERPRFDYIYQKVEITDEAIDKDIYRIQADLARTQFIQVYKYYRKRMDNYKNYLVTLRELHKCKVIENKDEKVEFYSNFPEMYQGIKLFHDAMDDGRKMQVHRDLLGKVLYIDWQVKNDSSMTRRREFEYHNDGLLSKLTDKINDEVVFETIFGENELGEIFFEYMFSPGFIPRNYNYYIEVFYQYNRPLAQKFIAMNGHVLGTIYKEYDAKDHLIRETWCKGETSKILREFTSTFDSKIGGYKLIERGRNGKIVNQEIVLSSIN